MTADAPTSAQQSGIGISSTWTIGAAFGATVTGVTGAVAVGMLINGCVFFICTGADAFGGSGKTVMRAVSFLGPGDTDPGSTDGMAAAASGAEGTDGGRGANGTDEVDIGGGRKVGGDGAETGGAGGPAVAPGDEGGTGRLGRLPLAGGRVGRLIRTVSRGLAAASVGLGETRGGSVIRTVSFFGSLGSGIERRR